jgi:hypothetical protein
MELRGLQLHLEVEALEIKVERVSRCIEEPRAGHGNRNDEQLSVVSIESSRPAY